MQSCGQPNRQSPHGSCFWHAADTPPLEGLLFLACGWSAVFDMLHMLASAQQAGMGGLITFLTTVRQGPRNLLPKALWCWCFERWEKRNGWASDGLHLKHENHEFVFTTRRSKLTHRAGETQFFNLESHACQLKWLTGYLVFYLFTDTLIKSPINMSSSCGSIGRFRWQSRYSWLNVSIDRFRLFSDI